MSMYHVIVNGQTRRFLKSPNERLDYGFNWRKWLMKKSDTIATFVITPEEGADIVVDDEDNDEYVVVAWVSGGVEGQTYALTCQITTVGGRVAERTAYFTITKAGR